jgi:hypothetical protein
VSVRLLYSSLATMQQRALAEHATRAAIGNRSGDWAVSLVDPPRQALLVVTVDGSNGYTRTWAFEETDQRFDFIRDTVARDLPGA